MNYNILNNMSNAVLRTKTVPDFYSKPVDKYLCFVWFSAKLEETEKSLELMAKELQTFMGWDEDVKPIGTIIQNYYRMSEDFKKLKKQTR